MPSINFRGYQKVLALLLLVFLAWLITNVLQFIFQTNSLFLLQVMLSRDRQQQHDQGHRPPHQQQQQHLPVISSSLLFHLHTFSSPTVTRARGQPLLPSSPTRQSPLASTSVQSVPEMLISVLPVVVQVRRHLELLSRRSTPTKMMTTQFLKTQLHQR